MNVVVVLQILIPSVVAALSALLVYVAARRADATQKASIEAELRKIEDDLRNQCIVELHRRKIASYLALLAAMSRLSLHLVRGENRGSDTWESDSIHLMDKVSYILIQTATFTARPVMEAMDLFGKALAKWGKVSYVHGAEEDEYISGQMGLVMSMREDLGVESIPENLFKSLLARSHEMSQPPLSNP